MPTIAQLPSTSFPLSISAKKKKGYIYIYKILSTGFCPLPWR